jgi:hypothetical protein
MGMAERTARTAGKDRGEVTGANFGADGINANGRIA